MIPWAEQVGSAAQPGYQSTTQQWWALGAIIGSFVGAPLAAAIGRRVSYFLMSLGATALTWSMFRLTAPLEPSFLPIVFAQGLVATLYFGWLPLYLPELFPTRVRATGAGIAMNIGRFAHCGRRIGGRLSFKLVPQRLFRDRRRLRPCVCIRHIRYLLGAQHVGKATLRNLPGIRVIAID